MGEPSTRRNRANQHQHGGRFASTLRHGGRQCFALPVARVAVHLRVAGAGSASASLPVTPFMFTMLPAMTATSAPFPVRTPVAATSVNVSVMTIMARQLDRGVDCTSKPLAASLRGRTACRVRRAVSLGSSPTRIGVRFASPVRVSSVTRICTSLSSSVRAFAHASGTVLRKTAVSSPCTAATQSPWRLPSASFARVDSLSLIPSNLSFLTACRGFGSHTPRS